MLKWVPYALVRIALCFVLGILLAIYNPQLLDREQSLFLFSAFAILYVLLWIFLKGKSYTKYNTILAVVGFTAISLLGYLNLKIANQSLNDDHFIHLDKIEAFKGLVTDVGHETDKTHRNLVEVEKVLTNEEWQGASGNIYLYIPKSDSVQLQYGESILVYGKPSLLSPPQNPGEFDYKRFLTFQNIYHTQFITKDKIEIIGDNDGNYLLSKAFAIRKWATIKLSQAIKNPREQNIALALILGVKDGLNDDIKNAYSASGAMHVLAVSGLHVGIIYLILLFVLKRLQNNSVGRWVLFAISIFVLWTYAAVTGFSPSVLRAVTMFTAIALSKAMNRHTNIYNTLAGSALVLLIYDPYLIMSVGFQLSYLAVLGIVYLQPIIYAQFVSANWVVDKIWSITAVAIAAQLATFSLGLLYFHQFPTFFFLSNLVVIPGAFCILILGLAVLAVSWLEPLFDILGYSMEQLIWGINELVFGIMKIPNSQIKDVYITTPQTWLIIGFVLFSFLLFQKRKIIHFYIAVSCMVVFALLQWDVSVKNSSVNKITFYKVNRHTAFDVVKSGNSRLFSDATLLADADKQRFHIKPNHLMNGVMKSEQIEIDSSAVKLADGLKVVQVNGLIILICDGKVDWNLTIEQKLKYDAIILSKDFNKSVSWI
ncbi:ComEC/Rec2 family competence protein, partial [Fulvivirga lutimaris]|uniref:ComEC/Rec2 family competence protein n=1 Tax=Fulvivirga lutimaris TaxID=1819566 RepID=UPI0012BD6DF9